jgi:nitroreductase
MNEALHVIHNRRSVRAYDDRPIDRETVDTIIQAAMRAPTAGNMMLYSIIEIDDQALKDKLAVSCDNQPFIARAPLLLLFVADYQRWFDYFIDSDVEGYCQAQGQELRYPGEGDLMLACCDGLIAAQTAVLAAESLGIGSCYIGDILELYEYHQELLNLPQYVSPIALVCFGYPRVEGPPKKLTPRFPQENVHFRNRYERLDRAALWEMFASRDTGRYTGNAGNFGQHFYARKFGADFSVEMTRSVRAAIAAWTGQEGVEG